jgi:hypothetical protein
VCGALTSRVALVFLYKTECFRKHHEKSVGAPPRLRVGEGASKGADPWILLIGPTTLGPLALITNLYSDDD